MLSLISNILFNHVFLNHVIYKQNKFVKGAEENKVITEQPSSSSTQKNEQNTKNLCFDKVDGEYETIEEKSIKSALTFINNLVLGIEKEEERTKKYSFISDLWRYFANSFCYNCCNVRNRNISDEEMILIDCNLNIKNPIVSMFTCCTNLSKKCSEANKERKTQDFEERADEYLKKRFKDVNTDLVKEGLELLQTSYIELKKEMYELEKRKIEAENEKLDREERTLKIQERIKKRESESEEKRMNLEMKKIDLETLEIEIKEKQAKKLKEKLKILAESIETSDNSGSNSEKEKNERKGRGKKKQKRVRKQKNK